MKKAVILGLAPLLLSACVSTYAPQTPQEFRQAGGESKADYRKESLTVNRSAGDIANVLKDRHKQCLNGHRVERTFCFRRNGMNTCSTTNIDYSAMFNASSKGAELIVRSNPSGEHMVEVSKRPEGGYYMMIVDVTPTDKSHSRVDVYYHTKMATLFAGTKAWVNGTNLGCPDLALDYQ